MGLWTALTIEVIHNAHLKYIFGVVKITAPRNEKHHMLHNSDFSKGQHFFLSHQVKGNKNISLKLSRGGISKFTYEQHCLPNLAISFSHKVYLHYNTYVGRCVVKWYANGHIELCVCVSSRTLTGTSLCVHIYVCMCLSVYMSCCPFV